jgi:hypothetical protein
MDSKDSNSASPPPAAGASHAAQMRRFGADVASGAHSAAKVALPVVKRNATRFGDWLASIGWAKFFLLSVLVLILAGALASFAQRRGPAIVIDTSDVADSVKIDVAVGPNGIIVSPPKPTSPPAPPKLPKTDRGATSSSKAPNDVGLKIYDKGVRIVKDKDGKQYSVVIDEKGVRIEEAPADEGKSWDAVVKEEEKVVEEQAAASTEIFGVPKGGILVPTDPTDAEKVTESLEAARAKIEDIVSDQVRRQVSRRVRQHEEESGDWVMSFAFLLILAAIIVKIVLGSKKKAESRAQAATMTAAEEGLKRQLAEAQLKTMQAQVEPHFLFNTLASVDYLIETDPSRASTMQKNLIQYLRAALPQMREGSTTLGKEVALCRSYLEILRVRMDDRLQFAITVPQGLASAQFPPMMLQSLVENAIKHGLEPRAEGGSLTITASISNGNLCVTVADTGLGFGAGSQPGTGVGLANVRERLAALYGTQAKLTIQANTPNGTIATIEVPYTYDASASAAPRPPADPKVAAQPA